MTQGWNPVRLSRDCVAPTVPAGQMVLLSEGGEVEVVQQLGASITVRPEAGLKIRARRAFMPQSWFAEPLRKKRLTSAGLPAPRHAHS